MLSKLKRHEEALNVFVDICRKVSPPARMHYSTRGWKLTELDRHQKALDVFDAILAKNKDNINVIYAKARSKAALGQYSQAMELLTKAVSGSPKVIRRLGAGGEGVPGVSQRAVVQKAGKDVIPRSLPWSRATFM